MRIEVETDVETPARDGTLLRADVYRPAGAGALPTLLRRTPYDKSLAVRSDADVLRLVRAGYAVVVQDVRGRYASEGRFEPFRTEAQDGADAIAWAAAQPWSSGAVGMVGASYEGIAQWLAASAAPPALRAIAPVVTSADPYDGWAYQGGAFELGFGLLWNAANLAAEPLADDPRDGFEAAARRRPLRDLAPHAGLASFHRDWLDHPARDAWWEQLVPRARIAAVAVPALAIGGWYDLFLRGTLAGHRRMRVHANGSRLVVGPWSHMVSGGAFPQRSYGRHAAADAIDTTALQLRWFDRHLRGIENGVEREPPVRLFVMGADRWRDADDWPLPGTEWTRFHLGAGGTLSPEAPGAASAGGEDAYRYDPRDPVPTTGGATFLPGQKVAACAGQLDQRAVQRRADVLVYTTPPLDRDVEAIGPVELVLYVSSSARDTDFTGKLVDVHPDGRAELLTDGIVRARWRASQTTPAALVPGQVHELRIDLGATANRFSAGHRIQLEVSSSNFPRFDRNTNTGGAIAHERDGDAVVAVNRVHHGRAHPSHLVLPLAPS